MAVVYLKVMIYQMTPSNKIPNGIALTGSKIVIEKENI